MKIFTFKRQNTAEKYFDILRVGRVRTDVDLKFCLDGAAVVRFSEGNEDFGSSQGARKGADEQSRKPQSDVIHAVKECFAANRLSNLGTDVGNG